MGAGHLNESVAFDEPVQSKGAGGVVSTIWTERHACHARVIYQRGSETVEAARLEGRAIYKWKIRSCTAARAITTDWQARDVRRAKGYAVIEVDAITDRAWIYVVVEGGKAA
ncbi:MAG: head-tail adaptor protein [Alphaproteobacteria bacterium]|uniref:Putative head-tail joining protein n=1 Tax=viral metagenome TaxID=1070528 RepID=A0A6M3KBD8_9ZZZZ|nr:head-tail adaptor protein [Alphaproteobacteria bacterium]MBU1280265.1 head-tail adaptor protein [Alphaproteobacteria bacterium]MBU1573004.1 head-tail adaptor protein [Alphaproteobacteria bacterium]MBU1827213.1 head-tail adaptor protein [Alphaproteobacteria bacterium]MBU2079963.1 head-tail adaptor protein [Alphaproteobacteria bacterium]